jgi:hypothetical protein
LDITGLAVVLAFRLSGVKSDFPNIITQHELVQCSHSEKSFSIDFKKWSPNDEDKLRYFKGESFGVNSIYVSGSFRKKTPSLSFLIKNMNKVIKKAESTLSSTQSDSNFVNNFLTQLNAGPDWCKNVTNELVRFTKEEMLGTLKKTVLEMKKYGNHNL